ncbi:MAG TPA: conjugal transfer protein TrbF [Candidatus Limnocylindrales bacterium]|nr:conjugal transfer protein TrbF [Candidatus Limnocylindrales bacterium]
MPRQPLTTPTGVLETPYLRAQQVWDDRIGSARVQARNWRFMALGGLVANLLLGGGLIYQSLKAQVVPYVVEVESQGEVRAVGPAAVLYRPSQAAIQHQVREFVRTIRGLATDPIVVRERWLQVYAGVTPRGATLLNSYARERDPFGKVGKVSIAVDVQRVLPLTETSYDVQWTETTYDANGVKMEDAKYSGLFAVRMQQPRTAQALKENPLGIYIDTFAWSRKDQ